MNIAICDDDRSFVKELKKILESYFLDKTIDVSFQLYYSGIELLKSNQNNSKNPIHFLFIDMEMSSLNGIDTLKHFRKNSNNSIVYIVSKHENYIFKSLEIFPFDYIIKPINQTDLFISLDRGFEEYKRKNRKILLQSGTKHIFINLDQIITVESKNRFTYLHTTLGDIKTTRKISDLEKHLIPYGFLKTHKSFIINMSSVIYYDKNLFHLINGYTADISLRKRSEIINKFEEYILNSII